MTESDNRPKQTKGFRELAEKMVREGKGRSSENLDSLVPEDIRLMFHELSVHQLELEMQNEELRQTQAKLDAARARYFDLYDLAPVGYCTLSENGLIKEPNLTLANLLGVDRSLLNNQPLSRSIVEEDQDVFYQCKQHLESGEPHSCELRMVKENGTVFWANITTAGARQSGSTLECRVAINDISKRKQTEEALRERESQYHQIVDTAREGIWVMDANERTTFVNNHLVALLGYEPQEMKERPIEYFMYPEDIANHVSRMKEREQGQSDTYERRFRGKDGRTVWTIVSASPLLDEEGAYTGSFAMLTDITARKRAEEQLRQSEQHANETKNLLKLVLDTIPVRLFWKDLNLTYMGCNLLFAQDAGYEVPEELIGLDDYAMGWKEQADAYRRDDREVITSGQPKLHYEEVQTTPDGKQIWLSTSKVPLRDDEGKIIGILGSYEDITHQKRAEEELIKAQKIESLGVISGGIAHDFNNILMVMLGNISLAKMLLPPTEQAYAYLHLAEEASQKAKDLALQFLTFSQEDKPVKKVLSAANLIKSYGRLALSGAKSICEYNIPNDLWNIEADDAQMGQVLTNLLINADQSMEEGGTIRIDCENAVVREDLKLPLPNGNYLKIRIQDQGIGIPHEYLDKIFDPYFTTKETGRGLGLTATYSIVKKHKGHIAVESAMGAGTTFTLYLPASLVPVAHPKKEEAEVTYGNGKILVLDDDELLLRVVGTMLEALGYEAEFALDGEECVLKYKEARQAGQPFDAVIMDLIVPGGMGGREAMQRLLEIDPHTKGIVTSGYSNNSILTDFSSYGFSGVIAKPYRFSALSKQLQQILDMDDTKQPDDTGPLSAGEKGGTPAPTPDQESRQPTDAPDNQYQETMLMNDTVALLIVDPQNDFFPGGALAVPEGDRVVAPLNRAAECFTAAGLPVFVSRDWHPAESGHFQSFGGPWPEHCVQGTNGAAFHPDLRLPESTIIISKGIEPHTDGYSAFDGISWTGLPFAEMLENRNVHHLCIGGLATDYCVRATVLEALKQGLAVTLLVDCVAGVDITPGDSQRALKEMQQAGARILSVDKLRLQQAPAQE